MPFPLSLCCTTIICSAHLPNSVSDSSLQARPYTGICGLSYCNDPVNGLFAASLTTLQSTTPGWARYSFLLEWLFLQDWGQITLWAVWVIWNPHTSLLQEAWDAFCHSCKSPGLDTIFFLVWFWHGPLFSMLPILKAITMKSANLGVRVSSNQSSSPGSVRVFLSCLSPPLTLHYRHWLASFSGCLGLYSYPDVWQLYPPLLCRPSVLFPHSWHHILEIAAPSNPPPFPGFSTSAA